MNIKAKDAKIKYIFSRKKYTIPDYQREYSWTDNEEIPLFWEDFSFYLDGVEDNFFIGPMVMMGADIDAENFDVIDGQQRLITIAVFISVIREKFKLLGEKDLASGLQQYLIFLDKRSAEQVIIDTESPHPYFQNKILNSTNYTPKKDDEKLIENARKYFDKEISERLSKKVDKKEKIVELEKIRDYLFNIDTVLIVSDDETDAYTIFETINTRGKNLQSLDLIKNFIVKKFKKQTGVKEPSSTWKEILKNISIDRYNFFNRFWASWHKKENESKLYRRFSKYVQKEVTPFSDPNYLLNALLISSEVYRKIIDSKLDDWKINKNYPIYYSIRNVKKLFGLKVHYPLFMALIEEFDNKKITLAQLKEGMQIVEHFHFLFTYIMSYRASGLDNKYSRFAIKLRDEKDKNKVFTDLREELKEKIPTLIEFKEKFNELKFNERKEGIQYVLLKLEKEKTTSINIDTEEHSLDHFEPESSKSLSKVQHLGNLYLLEKSINEDKDDLKPFDDWNKSNITIREFLLNNTKYKTTSEYLVNLEKWDDSDI
ncbi:MAG: DUF262 domain-containing protein, partial [Patescibacteria group bacterium]|nr:DUF262 domain-containing protein [Patescibacteria group bacterium]